MGNFLTQPLRNLSGHDLIIRVDSRTALLLALGVLVLAINLKQAYGLVLDLFDLTRSIHFHLVQAPLEAAMNSARAALDKE